MNECHQSYPWRRESKTLLIYPGAAHSRLVEWSAKDEYVGTDRLCPRHSEYLGQCDSGQTALRKVPLLEDEGATVGVASVEYANSTVQPKSNPKPFSGLI